MDLYAAESKKIDSLVQEWLDHPEHELEATFGQKGTVDATTFLSIAQRLRAKGYEALPQDDRLSILTPNSVRLSIQGLDVLQGYCNDDIIAGKTFTAMIKDRTSSESNLNLEEYEMRIKSRRELPLSETDPKIKELLESWTTVKKAFRLIRRWSFEGDGMRIDMSIVRSSPTDSRGEYRWARSFQDYALFKQPPVYEVEVELLRDKSTETLDGAKKALIRGIGDVLRAIQKNTLLIRKSVKDQVLAQYAKMNKSDKFRGVAPVTLEKKHMIAEIRPAVPNIRTGYNVTDKADGLRCLGFCNDKGELFMIDMGMNVYRTGLRNEECANTLTDGEWVTRNKAGKAINHFLLFDMYRAGEVDIGKLPFAAAEGEDSRWVQLQKWTRSWENPEKTRALVKGITDTTRLQVAMKTFFFANKEQSTSIFTLCGKVLSTPHIYNTDGLILTPNDLPLPPQSGDTFFEQFKWKPAVDNTIDFLINAEKDAEIVNIDKVTPGIHPETEETIRFKTLRLYVGSDKDSAYDDPRATILNQLPMPVDPRRMPRGQKRVYKPNLFHPKEFPDTMANTCYRIIEVSPETGEEVITTEHGKEPLQDRTIVEMRYDPLQSPGWRWIPIRIRHDKTERLLRGQVGRTLNSEKVANTVWNSIHDPITESMIRTGAEDPTKEELDAMMSPDSTVAKMYYMRKAPKQDIQLVSGLRKFHNQWVKEDVLYRVALDGGNKTVIDLACGKGGDLQKWQRKKARFVLGVDTAGDNIVGAIDGAYSRYLGTIIEEGKANVPEMVFVIGDSSKLLINGAAGTTPEESDILRSVFGRIAPEGPVPKNIELVNAGALRAGADAAVCMFALHYFFANKEMLDGFVQNLADCVKIGGYFIGCCFDGQAVFNLLRGIETGQSKVGNEGDTPIWSIKKEYSADEFTADDDSIGMAVDVEFISIGAAHREYLVSFEYLQRRMKTIGFELLGDDELRAAKLVNSTNMFKETYEMAKKAGKRYNMLPSVEEFSFLNRWFIFKRRALAGVADDEDDALLDKIAALAAEDTSDENSDAESNAESNAESSLLPRPGADAKVAEKIIEKVDAAAARLPATDAKFAPAEIFLFGPNVSKQDTLKIGDPGAGHWLSLTSFFPIIDEDDTEYPTAEHYMAGMALKHGSSGGDGANLAKTLLSSGGSIHQTAEGQRRLKGKTPEAILKEEIDSVKQSIMPKGLAKYKIIIDSGKWTTIKEKYLRIALTQRWERDARFRKIVEAARDKGKYLLYYLGTASGSEMGGVRRTSDGRIDGENKVGRMIMELAHFRF